jgi:hypothetical protein
LAGSSRQELQSRIETIEETYEFMLAYAAQGLSTHEASKTGAQLREFLGRSATAIAELAEGFATVLADEELDADPSYTEFLSVLRDDARKAGSAFRLTMAQPAISSQLVDNLNASIHVRALLTDIFLLDEIITPRSAASAPA